LSIECALNARPVFERRFLAGGDRDRELAPSGLAQSFDPLLERLLREDCRRWSERFSIPFVHPDPEIFRQRASTLGGLSLPPRGIAGPRLLRGRRRKA
jgi:hypothetical protein